MRALLAALLLCSGAQATTFNFALNGTGEGEPNFYSHPDCFDGSPTFPQCANPYPIVWTGTASVSTDSTADGTYTGAHLLSFVFVSNVFFYPGGLIPDLPPSVTLAGGKVVSFVVEATGFEGSHFGIEGLAASYGRHEFHQDIIGVTGTLSAIPEPETYALMLAGLMLIHGITRKSSARTRREWCLCCNQA